MKPSSRATARIGVLLVLVGVLGGIVGALIASSASDTAPRSANPRGTTTTPPDVSIAVWPTAASAVRPRDPVSAARGFAVEYVGFVDPVVGDFRAGDSRSGEVMIQRNARGPVTTVMVRQLGSDGTWWVLGSYTNNIQIASPPALGRIASPVTLRGMSTAFEAQVAVELREDDTTQPLVQTFVMGANGELGPFVGSLSFATPRASAGALVLFTRSAEDGEIAEASVIRVGFAVR